MSNWLSLSAEHGWRAYVYAALFPLDLFGDDTDARLAYQHTKITELVPFLGVLCPLLVMLSAATSMGWIALLVFLSLEAFLIALMTKFHLKLAGNQLMEVWLNLWISMVLMATTLGLLALLFGGWSSPNFNWD
ncbi:MAG: hypothetical protein VKP62_15140 [Candidatus Sericytochromatia bacterium]|nr:hypothetical protein [Candidatus Sericytochromatia bacterium]